jgi:hypothetical protein
MKPRHAAALRAAIEGVGIGLIVFGVIVLAFWVVCEIVVKIDPQVDIRTVVVLALFLSLGAAASVLRAFGFFSNPN